MIKTYNMKKTLLLTLLLGLCFLMKGQVLKIQVGISNSSLDWELGNNSFKIYDEKITGHSIFIGLDYLEKKYFNLSSNIGIISKGGSGFRFYVDPFGMPLISTNEKATIDYLSFNNTIDIKFPIKEKIFPFLSIGPRIDYLISSNNNFKYNTTNYTLNKFSLGLNMGAGIKYQFSRFQIGVRGDYLVNLNKISDYNNFSRTQEIKDNTFLVNTVIGIKLH